MDLVVQPAKVLYVTSNDTQTKRNNLTDGNGGPVAFTTDSVDTGREIIRGYEAKELAAYVSSVRQFAQVISKIDKGQRTEWKAEVAKGYTITDKDGNEVEVPAVSMGTVDAMVGVGQWILALNDLGVTVAEIQGLGITKSALQKGKQRKALDKVNREDVPDPLNLEWLYEIGALKRPAVASTGKREARPEGNDAGEAEEGTSAAMGGNEKPETIKEALDGIRSRQPKVMHHDGVYETLTMEELETMLQNNGLINAKIKKAQAKLKASMV